MHEYSLAAEIVKITLAQMDQARQKEPEGTLAIAGTSRLKGLKLKVGALAGVFPDSLRLYLDLIFTEQGFGPVTVEIESVPARFQCQCGHTYTADLILSPCPACNGFERELIEGDQCVIETIEMEDPDTASPAAVTPD